jgi:MEMO1 family protein
VTRLALDSWVREPAVAGRFYADDPAVLRSVVRRHLASPAADHRPTALAALIAPHAGYRYSGATAGTGWARLAAGRTAPPRRIVLLGPSHRMAVEPPGIGVSTAAAWRTPLGDVPLDGAAAAELVEEGLAAVADDAHASEHSLEVHLPFLLEAFGPVPVVPLVTGGCGAGAAAAALRRLWDGDESAVVVSSDLSHYLPEAEARRRDDRTLAAVVEGRVDDIGPEDACGRTAIAAVLLAARSHGVAPSLLAVSTSADTAGDRDRVVGYASVAFTAPPPLTDAERSWLVERARAAVAHEVVRGDPDPAADVEVPPRLRLLGPCFVTLRHGERLLGCIGSLEAVRPLWLDVVHNARAAAFDDPRFPPLGPDDLSGLGVKVSVLSATEVMPGERDALIGALRPGLDGLLIEAGERRGTFLPSVWESLGGPDEFVSALAAKAGLVEGAWPAGLRAFRYTTDEFGD